MSPRSRSWSIFLAAVLAGCGPPAPPGQAVVPDPAAPATAAFAAVASEPPTAPEVPVGAVDSTGCLATRSEAVPEHYAPGAPERASIGDGFALSGVILAAGSCQPVAGGRVEVWLPAPDGDGSAARGALTTGPSGEFAIETDIPGAGAAAVPAIYLRASAEGYAAVVVTHWPAAGATAGNVAIVLPRQ